ncbi:MAG TPA: AraC family transcriptional regulator [Acidimicrobiales bacterium]
MRSTRSLRELGNGPVQPRPTLPMPCDPRAVDVALGILRDPACRFTLEEWADAVGASPSTLRRAFLTETSLTFSEWRARARLDAALPLLADGMTSEQVALQVGYASRSGFVEAYRRHFGHPPAR